ncbi:hypothetical protein BDP81DRAFT_429688 [Colletotrichum phormii]|uniref:Uncharacterized protein n=1 Tax=Colletotrichum phormii TaxID=359342 RepID=A0AAI9ZNX7_9PEZI|nr:uncharacterized protein BDP81DRAFT_429688 [Colletotrichum phormii]KAK1635428.1 hypothetical protein BDP81DRAFT_429688 [Colletotrichum phormii]
MRSSLSPLPPPTPQTFQHTLLTDGTACRAEDRLGDRGWTMALSQKLLSECELLPFPSLLPAALFYGYRQLRDRPRSKAWRDDNQHRLPMLLEHFSIRTAAAASRVSHTTKKQTMSKHQSSEDHPQQNVERGCDKTSRPSPSPHNETWYRIPPNLSSQSQRLAVRVEPNFIIIALPVLRGPAEAAMLSWWWRKESRHDKPA